VRSVAALSSGCLQACIFVAAAVLVDSVAY
jgi:hypothetical protein